MIPLFKKDSNPNKILFDIQGAAISHYIKKVLNNIKSLQIEFAYTQTQDYLILIEEKKQFRTMELHIFMLIDIYKAICIFIINLAFICCKSLIYIFLRYVNITIKRNNFSHQNTID